MLAEEPQPIQTEPQLHWDLEQITPTEPPALPVQNAKENGVHATSEIVPPSPPEPASQLPQPQQDKPPNEVEDHLKFEARLASFKKRSCPIERLANVAENMTSPTPQPKKGPDGHLPTNGKAAVSKTDITSSDKTIEGVLGCVLHKVQLTSLELIDKSTLRPYLRDKDGRWALGSLMQNSSCKGRCKKAACDIKTDIVYCRLCEHGFNHMAEQEKVKAEVSFFCFECFSELNYKSESKEGGEGSKRASRRQGRGRNKNLEDDN